MRGLGDRIERLVSTFRMLPDCEWWAASQRCSSARLAASMRGKVLWVSGGIGGFGDFHRLDVGRILFNPCTWKVRMSALFDWR